MSTCLAVLFAVILTQTRPSEIFELQQLENKTKEASEGFIFDADEGDHASSSEDAKSQGSHHAPQSKQMTQ